MHKKDFFESEGYKYIERWMANNGQVPFEFQKKVWSRYTNGYDGMVVAPTGFGKTYSAFLAVIADFLNHPKSYHKGLKLLWITPLRSLAKDLVRAMQEAIDEIGLDWVVQLRNGDTDPKIRQQQSRQMPDILVVTPESLHLLLAQRKREQIFKNLRCVVVDEWHELLGNKRGVLVELALSYLRHHVKKMLVWGITATIGNIDQAMGVLLPAHRKVSKVISKEKKKIRIIPVYPDEVETLPWAGHLGSKMVDKVIPIVLKSKTTIIFTNTRSQSEMWYQLLLDQHPDFAGQIAIHHSSIEMETRQWIEESLSVGKLKAVISTSSLDLGVDFKPVDTVIQIGSSKGVARFVQRAGRSGHSPFETSVIYFVPTHSLELIEVAALKEAVKSQTIEDRIPMVQTFDVLIQFLVTVALGGGFKGDEMLGVIKKTHAFRLVNVDEWHWCLQFITVGGQALQNYQEFHKVVLNEEGIYSVVSRKIGMLHRMNIGVIASESMLRVKFLSGGYIGVVEEYFISKLAVGEKFILAGRVLELLQIKEMTVFVKSASGKAKTPSWLGGRLPLSSNLSRFLREKIARARNTDLKHDSELTFLSPLLKTQEARSHIPGLDEFLVEKIQTKEGVHLFMYPFEGRLIHEVMATLVAFRLSRLTQITFSIAMNDYGFELYSDKDFPLVVGQLREILSKAKLMEDVISSINATEMAKRKFRDIAVISGMVIQNLYGQQRNNRSLQASSGLIFQVLEEHEPHNLLVKQAYDEVFNQQVEADRLFAAFDRIFQSEIILKELNRYSPLSFPIKVDSLRHSLSSEDLASRVKKIIERSEKKTKKF